LELMINGRAFHPSLPGGESDCALRLSGRFLVARMPSGEVLKLDLHRAAFQRGGPEGADFVYSSTAPEGPTFVSHDPELHRAAMQVWPSGRRAAEPRSAKLTGSARLSRYHIAMLAVAASVVGLVLGALLLTGPLARVVLRFVPRSVDVSIGDAAYPHVQKKIGGLREEAAVREPVQAVLDRLVEAVPNLPFHFRVAVCDSPMLNAFALPGGQIVITTRMLAALQSAEELAGVLAHEMNHVLGRHSMEMTIRASGIRFLVHILSGGHLAVGIAASVWSVVGVMGYSREKERDADRNAVRLLVGAGIDPKALLPMFKKLLEEEKRHEGPPSADRKLMEKFRTHPETADRIADVESEIVAASPVTPQPLAVDYGALVRMLQAEERAR
jgi:beta-barrel assembly-enhancing protease